MDTLSVELYKKLYLIRRAEEKIQELYSDDEMKTPMHMSMGEEAIVSGVIHAMEPDDQVVGTYRSHALYLAKTGETDQFFAEMYGKASAIAKGKSGSMHLTSPENGLICCSAIVGTSIPIGMGLAFANKYKENGKKVAAFFGDGAIDEGVFWETINFACLKSLPMIFVCEDNNFAVHTRRNKRQSFNSIGDLISQFGCNVFEEKTTDPEIIFNIVKKAIEMMNKNNKPCFIRFRYYRYLEHVGINEDFEAGYRSKEEFIKWFEKDPVRFQRERLVEKGASDEDLKAIEDKIDRQIGKSIDFAKRLENADTAELYKGVFYENDNVL